MRGLLGVKRRNSRAEHMFSALTPKTDIAQYGQHVRSVPLPDSCIAANCASFDHLVGTGERGLLGQPRFAEPLHQQLRV